MPVRGRQAERNRGRRRAALLRCAALLGVALAGACSSERLPSGTPVWRLDLEPDSVAAVGDGITLRVTAQWPDTLSGVRLRWRPPGDSLLVVSADSSALSAASGWTACRYELRLLAPRAGAVWVPPAALVTAEGRAIASTPARRLRITSQLPDSAAAQLAPAAPPVGLGKVPRWVYLLGGAALAAAGWLLARRLLRRARGGSATLAPEIPAGEEFTESLRALLQRDARSRGRVRVFYQDLSWILRRYLGRRWCRPALEATRPEILRWLPETSLGVAEQLDLAAWLETTDRIKFAGLVPAGAEAEELVTRARQMVARMEEQARALQQAQEQAHEGGREQAQEQAQGGGR